MGDEDELIDAVVSDEELEESCKDTDSVAEIEGRNEAENAKKRRKETNIVKSPEKTFWGSKESKLLVKLKIISY